MAVGIGGDAELGDRGGKTDRGDSGMCAGANDGFAAGVGVAGFRGDGGPSAGRALPKIEGVRGGLDAPEAAEGSTVAGVGSGAAVSGSFTPVGSSDFGSSDSGKIWFSGAASMGLGNSSSCSELTLPTEGSSFASVKGGASFQIDGSELALIWG